LNTRILLTFSNSAAVTGVPLGKVNGFVTSLRVRVTGKVVVASAGITVLIIIVR
jgi:hypothetical protein